MNRRGFLSLLSQATVGAIVAYSFPSIIVPKNIVPATAYPLAPRGLATLINAGYRFDGWSTVSFPNLNGPTVDLGGAVISPQMFDYAKRFLDEMRHKTSLVTEFRV